MGKIRATYAEIFARCRETYGCFIHAADPRNAVEVSAEEREAFYERLYNEPGFAFWQGNFRDVLIGLGMYPGEGTPGSEIAGIVTGTGPGVARLQPGDRVMGMAVGGGFGPAVVTDAQLLVPIPAGWSFAMK